MARRSQCRSLVIVNVIAVQPESPCRDTAGACLSVLRMGRSGQAVTPSRRTSSRRFLICPVWLEEFKAAESVVKSQQKAKVKVEIVKAGVNEFRSAHALKASQPKHKGGHVPIPEKPPPKNGGRGKKGMKL